MTSSNFSHSLWVRLLAIPFASLLISSGHAAQIFSQDFTSSTNVNDFVGTNTATQFQFIETGTASPSPTISTSISNDALVWDNAANGDPTPTSQAGWALTADFSDSGPGGSLSVFSAQANLTFGATDFTNGSAVAATIRIGDATTGASVGIPGGPIRNRLEFLYRGNDVVTARLNGREDTLTTFAFDTARTFSLFGNNSGVDGLSYLGPDGLTHTLNDDRISIFIDDMLYQDNAALLPNADNRVIRNILVGFNAEAPNVNRNIDDGTLLFNSLVINDDLNIVVPEPTSVALLTGAFGMLLFRRSRRK